MADILFTQIASENIRSGTDLIQTSGRETIGKAPGLYVADAAANAALFAAHPRFVARSSNGRHFRALPEDGRIQVDISGAKGDGVTDDGPAIRAAVAYAAAIGAQGVRFGQQRYRMESMTFAESGVATGAQASLALTSNVVHDFGGVELVRQLNGGGIAFGPASPAAMASFPIVADVQAGDITVRLAATDAAQLAPGNTVFWMLGELPYDTPETLNWDIAKVVAVSGEYVTLDKPIPEGLTLSSVTGPNKRLVKIGILTNCALRDFTITASNVEYGVAVYGGKRITLERVGGSNLGAGLFAGQYCDGVSLIDCWQDGVVLSQASFGAAFGFAECRNVSIVRPHARSILNLVKAEAGAEVSVLGGHFENTITNQSGQSLGTDVAVILAVGKASVSVHDLTVTGHGGYRLAETSNGAANYSGTVHFSGITRLRHPADPWSIPVTQMSGRLDMILGGIREIYDFDRLRHWKRRFALRDNQSVYAFGPPGIMVRANIYAAEGLSAGVGQQLTGFWLGRAGDNGYNLANGVNGQIVAGQNASLPIYGGAVAGVHWAQRNQQFQILCTTSATGGLDQAAKFVEFEAWFAPLVDASYAMTEKDWRGAGADRDFREAHFPAFDLPAIPAGASATIELPIPAMMAGDFVDAVRVTGEMGALHLSAAEARNGFVRLTFGNAGAVALDPPAMQLAVSYSTPQAGN
ncbi:MAG: hypothetical protein IPG83_01325 [Novosphingobium sp.]|nr:hypothetical protein [Novosphingobium sp.]